MIDFILDIANHIIRNGLSWATTFGIIVVLLKQKKLRRLINKQLPRIIRDQDDDRADRMEQKIDLLMQERGVTWSGPQQTLSEDRQNYRKWYLSLRKDSRQANHLRRIHKMSRKLLLMVFGAIVMVLNQFGITLDPETIIAAGTLIISAIIGQAVVDTNGVGQYAPLKEKLKSKKLWTALGGSVLIVLSDYYNLHIPADIIYWIVGIGVAFIFGRSAVSVVHASKNGIINDAPKSEPKIEESDSQNYSH